MVGIDIAGRIDLQAVVVLVGVLEEAVHRVQHLVGDSEEPFACHTPIIQTLLTLNTKM
jgi:hypothetical protein